MQFVAERNWDQYHTIRNLNLALAGEVGELCEIFQWRGELKPEDLNQKDKQRIGEELSDILNYVVLLANKC